MQETRPLPSYLIQRFHGWQATTYNNNRARYRRLAQKGQSPAAMIISCCDSRVHPDSLFGASEGELFVHRNIANLVPPYNPDGDYHGTSAAVEYGVTALGVAHLVVMGHSHCGGIKGCHDMCCGKAPELEVGTSFVGRWLGALRPAFAAVQHLTDAERLRAMEKEAVLLSLRNLMTFPFVSAAVAQDKLTLHGLWKDIAEGVLEQYDPAREAFVKV